MENTENKNEEIIIQSETAMTTAGVDKVSLFVSEPVSAQRYIEAVGSFRAMIPRATKPTDWVSFGDPKENDGKKCGVYLQEYAASQLSRLLQTKFGYNIIIDKPVHLVYPDSTTPWGIEKVVDGVSHLEVIVQGGASVLDIHTGQTERIEPIIGASSTTDPFVGKRYGDKVDPRSIQFGLLLKKAIANYKGNCYREIWGLRGFTMFDLARCGLDVSRVHDSMRRDAGGSATPEEKNAKEQLWDRILRAHDGKSEEAKKFLKNLTSYPAGTNKATGKSYPANAGYDNINQVYVTNKDGSENRAYKKIVDAVTKLEKDRGMAADDTSVKNEEGPEKLYMKFKKRLDDCQTIDEVLEVEKNIGAAKSLSAMQIKSLQNVASQIFVKLDCGGL